MNMRNLMAAGTVALMALPCAATAALGQAGNFAWQPAGGGAMVQSGKPGERSQAVFISSEMSFEGKTVKGAPYTAETINESIQTLGDGNRIVSSNRGSVARDSEGRIRREHSLTRFGPFAKSGEPKTMVFIWDPVANVNYIVDATEKSVRKMPLRNVQVWHDQKAGEPVDADVDVVVNVEAGTPEGATVITEDVRGREGTTIRKVEPGPDGQKQVVVVTTAGTDNGQFKMAVPAPAPHPGMPMEGFRYEVTEMGEPKTESLGKKTIEGVECDGTRTTVTIAAGAIGNERAIDIVDERWYSPELQLVVMSRHSDPRFGETSFRLANINRAEPDKALFVPPADYTVEDMQFKTLLRKPGKAGGKNE